MPTVLKLTGRLTDKSIAKTHQADKVICFKDVNDKITVSPTGESAVYRLVTQKGIYNLRYLGNNTWGNTCAGHKVKFTCKKIVAKLIYY